MVGIHLASLVGNIRNPSFGQAAQRRSKTRCSKCERRGGKIFHAASRVSRLLLEGISWAFASVPAKIIMRPRSFAVCAVTEGIGANKARILATAHFTFTTNSNLGATGTAQEEEK